MTQPTNLDHKALDSHIVGGLSSFVGRSNSLSGTQAYTQTHTHILANTGEHLRTHTLAAVSSRASSYGPVPSDVRKCVPGVASDRIDSLR